MLSVYAECHGALWHLAADTTNPLLTKIT